LTVILRLLNTWMAIETAYTNAVVPQTTIDALENDIHSMTNRFPYMLPKFHLVSETYPALAETDIDQTLDTILDEYEQ